MRAPYKTGNLRYNAIKSEMPDPNTIVLYVDEDIAPYMPYTNEEWINRSGKNPNEGWFDDAAQETLEYLAQATKGKIK